MMWCFAGSGTVVLVVLVVLGGLVVVLGQLVRATVASSRRS